MVVKKNNKKTNIPVAGWFLILGVAVIVGAVYLVDGRLLKTQVAPGEDTATVKDWESIGVPGLGVGMVGPTELCPSPTSASSPKPSGSPFAYLEAGGETRGGRVLGLRPPPSVSATPLSCPVGFEAEGFNKYEYDSIKIIQKTLINGLNPEHILTAVCRGKPDPPGCGEGAVGCAWMKFSDDSPNITLTGLYEEVEEEDEVFFKLVENAYVYPDGLNHPETREWVQGVYPSPAESDDELLFELHMSLWKLSTKDKGKLDGLHPKLQEVAQRRISGTEQHEKVHWKTFERYLPNYVAMINSPWYDTRSMPSVESLRGLIEDKFRSGWLAVAVLEEAEHKAFHEREKEELEKNKKDVPYDGLDNISCDYIRDMVGVFSLLVSGKGYGYASADYPTGGRLINTDSYEGKEYFTNTDIKIEARPKAGYEFREWHNDVDRSCAVCAGSKNPVCTLQISSEGNYGCIAVFEPIPTPTGTTGTPSAS